MLLSAQSGVNQTGLLLDRAVSAQLFEAFLDLPDMERFEHLVFQDRILFQEI